MSLGYLTFFSLSIFFINCNVALYEISPRPIPNCLSPKGACVIVSDNGGIYFNYMDRAQELYKEKRQIKIDGFCASSCTYLVNSLYLTDRKRVCITPNAKFGIHKGRITYTVGFHVTRTAEIILPYISPLQDLIDAHGGIPEFDKPIYFGYDKLKTIYPTCKGTV